MQLYRVVELKRRLTFWKSFRNILAADGLAKKGMTDSCWDNEGLDCRSSHIWLDSLWFDILPAGNHLPTHIQ